jgi:hypothetical protein
MGIIIDININLFLNQFSHSIFIKNCILIITNIKKTQYIILTIAVHIGPIV